MRKIKRILLTIIVMMFAICIVSIFVPELGKIAWMIITQIFWPAIKTLFLKDELLKIGVFLILLLIISGGSLYASKRTENKLWCCVGVILDFVSYAMLFL